MSGPVGRESLVSLRFFCKINEEKYCYKKEFRIHEGNKVSTRYIGPLR